MTNITNLANNIESISALTLNLRKLMYQKKVTEAELARRTNIPQPTLHKILSGKTGDPRASTLKSLADFFGITIDTLLSSDLSTGLSGHAVQTRPVAIISWTDCLHGETFLKQLTSANWHSWVITEYTSNTTYALTSKPSMEPRFPRSSVLIIDHSITPEDGDIVVVHFPNTDEATLREASIDGPTRALLSLGKQPQLVTTWDSDTKVLGVLVKSVFTFH